MNSKIFSMKQRKSAGKKNTSRFLISPKSFLLLLLFVRFTSAHAQTVDWVQYGGGAGDDLVSESAKDANRNYFVTGQIENSATFNSTTLSGGLFVAKYDSNGAQQWVVAYANDHTYGKGICLDKEGNIYVIGWMDSTVLFGSTLLTSLGDFDIILSKFKPNGDLIWVKQFGGAFADKGIEIECDKNDNLFFTGYLSSTAQLGNISTTAYNDSTDVFFAKCDTAGNVMWVRTAGGDENDQAYSIALDVNENIFITGIFRSTSYFNNVAYVSAGEDDIFISKYDSSGNLLWVNVAGDTENDHGLGVCADKNGNCYVSGNFNGTVSFGGITLTSTDKDLFVASYSPSGNNRWAHQAVAWGGDRGADIQMDENGRILLGGSFTDGATFDGLYINSAGEHDIFVARYDSLGSIEALLRAGGTKDDRCFTVLPDVGNNVVVSGLFAGTGTFGNYTITSSGGNDAVIVKMEPAEVIITSISDSVFCPSETFNVSYDIKGSFLAGNIFKLQLSNSSGSFISTTQIGSLTSTAAGTIVGTISSSPIITNNYKMRIVSTNPPCLVASNITFETHSKPVISTSGGTSICTGDTLLLIAYGASTYSWSPGTSLNTTTNDSVYAFPVSTTTYTVTGTSIYDCKNTATKTITTTSSSPTVTVTANGSATFCSNSNITLTAASVNGVSYQWLLNDINIPGAVYSTYTTNASGSYSCKVSNSCAIVFSNSIVVTANPLPLVSIPGYLPVCKGSPAFELTGATPFGGTYSGINVSNGIYNPIATGNYTITYNYSDSNACTATATTTLQVLSLPAVLFSPSENEFCNNGPSFILDGGTPAGGNYSGAGVVNGTFYPAITGPGNFSITYNYTNISGCSNADSKNITVNVCAGMNEAVDDFFINVYPNPAHDLLNLSISSSQSQWKVELINSIGATVQSIMMQSGLSSIDVDVLPRGIYLLVLRNDSKKYFEKIILE